MREITKWVRLELRPGPPSTGADGQRAWDRPCWRPGDREATDPRGGRRACPRARVLPGGSRCSPWARL